MWIISGCLLGFPCRYDGSTNGCEWVKEFAAFNDYVAVCPEVAGGLPIPRPAAEQVWMPADRKAGEEEGEEQVRILDEDGVAYQYAELGRVDLGGGGTIAYIMANYGMNVIDSGVAVLSMHAPWEVTSKADIYEAYKGYKSFLKAQ